MSVVVGVFLGVQPKPATTFGRWVFRNATIHSASFDDNELTGLFNAARPDFNFRFMDGVANEFTKDDTPEAQAKIFQDSVVHVPSGPTMRFLQNRLAAFEGRLVIFQLFLDSYVVMEK